MDNPKRKALSPARNGAVYPTSKNFGGARRLLLAGVGATALVVGAGACGGAMVPDYDVDSSGVAPGDARAASDAGPADAATAVEAPDAGAEGGDS